MKCIKCNKRTAAFNFIGEKALFCKDCSKIGMKDLIHNMCIDCGDKRANFNFEGLKPMYCKDCGTIDMVDISHQKCIDCGIKRRGFGILGKSPLYCKDCANKKMKEFSNIEMIDLNHKKCIICNKKRAYYNYSEKSQALYCKDDALVGMIYLDLIKCKCGTTASFNYPGKTKEFCCDCKSPEMRNVSSITCLKKDCNIQPSFNFITEKTPLYCPSHAEKFMVDIKHLHYNCDFCGLRYRVSKKNQTLCGYCNPDRNHKTKENEIKKLLEKNNYTFIQDKSIALDKTVCKSYRPDFLFDCNFHYVIIEVDEFKHRGTANTCDYNRMEAIQKILGLPVTFIRYNPDSKETSKLERESKLLEKLDFYLDLKIQKLDLLTINYLFY